ncbi:MAG TPA: pyridoxamine 5'-phosphate oxidase family protein, partial [Nitriliruptorales bacterium]|nr:pyridoxamine 5'-phosphate oxidase family protein [Nitriliruptorales bacterium]
MRRSKASCCQWSWAVERLQRCRHYWVATADAAGRPHLAALWGVWFDDAFHFSTGAESCKARDLAARAECSVAAEDPVETVVVNGRVERLRDRGRLTAVSAVYADKYASGVPDSQANPVFAVSPSTVIAVIGREPDIAARG